MLDSRYQMDIAKVFRGWHGMVRDNCIHDEMLGTRLSDGDYNSLKSSETPLETPEDSGLLLPESEEDKIPF